MYTINISKSKKKTIEILLLIAIPLLTLFAQYSDSQINDYQSSVISLHLESVRTYEMYLNRVLTQRILPVYNILPPLNVTVLEDIYDAPNEGTSGLSLIYQKYKRSEIGYSDFIKELQHFYANEGYRYKISYNEKISKLDNIISTGTIWQPIKLALYILIVILSIITLTLVLFNSETPNELKNLS